MPKKRFFLKKIFFTLLFLISVSFIYAQGKPKPKGKVVPTKATIAADMDCLVKLNGAAKLISVKAYTPTPATIKVGENFIEATSIDKKSTFKSSFIGTAGGATIVEVSFFDDSKFLDYVKKGDVNMVEKAITKDPALIKNENQSLTTSPLEIAIENSQVEIVKLLLNKGASFTEPDNIFPLHKTALYASSMLKGKATVAPDKELFDLFLSKGCKITDIDDGGNTPLHSAVRGGKLELVVFLLKQGADVNAKNDFGDTPLKIAEDKGFVSIIDALSAKGAVDK